MLRDRNIAFFIDVDNVGLNNEQFADILSQLNVKGSIMSGKIYGAGERKHKEIYATAKNSGYTLASTMRVKRRGRKDFDARIYVDVVDTIAHAPGIDTICIVAQPTDLVHLYSYIHSRGLKIVALDNADEAGNALIDEVIYVKEVAAPVKKPAKPASKPAKPASSPAPAKVAEPAPKKPEQPAPAEEKEGLDRTDELLREIERLRTLASEPTAEQEPKPVEEPSPEVEEDEPEEVAPAPHDSYTPSNERDLIRRIEEIRNNSQGDDEEFVDEIRKLLDDLD